MEENHFLAVIAAGENGRVEFKERMSSKRPHSICAEIAAFASSGGGMLFLGVGDDGSIVGLAETEASLAMSQIEHSVAEKVSPQPQWTVKLVSLQGKLILVIMVAASGHPIHYYDGRPYHRVGTSSRSASPSEVTSRHMQFAIRDEFRRATNVSTAAAIYGQGELATMCYSTLVKRLLEDFPALQANK